MHMPKTKKFLNSFMKYHTLRMLDQTYDKRWSQFLENYDTYQYAKNNFITYLFLEILHTYFEYFRFAWSHPSNMIVSTCRKLWFLSAPKSNFILHLFFETLQRFWKLANLGTLCMTCLVHQNW